MLFGSLVFESFCFSLASSAATQQTKVIIMSALSQAEDKARAEKLGANKYLVKSQVTLEDIVKTVKEVLEQDSNAASKDLDLSKSPITDQAPSLSQPVVTNTQTTSDQPTQTQPTQQADSRTPANSDSSVSDKPSGSDSDDSSAVTSDPSPLSAQPSIASPTPSDSASPIPEPQSPNPIVPNSTAQPITPPANEAPTTEPRLGGEGGSKVISPITDQASQKSRLEELLAAEEAKEKQNDSKTSEPNNTQVN